MSVFLQKLCGLVDIQQSFTSKYHPQTNFQVEQFNRTILDYIRTFCSEKGAGWELFFCAISCGYENSVHHAICMTPYNSVLSSLPPHMALSKFNVFENSDTSPQSVNQRFLDPLRSLMVTVTTTLLDLNIVIKHTLTKHFDGIYSPWDQERNFWFAEINLEKNSRLTNSCHGILALSISPRTTPTHIS